MIAMKELSSISAEEVPWLERVYLNQGCRYVCAFEDVCIGILVYEVKEEILYIRYMSVVERMRKQGVGGELFGRIQEIAQKEAPDGIIVSGVVSQEQQAEVIRFFMKYGFMMPEFGDQVATISVEDWRNSYLAEIPIRDNEVKAHIYSMEELPSELEYDYRNRVRPKILPCCWKENVKGTLLSEYSIAYAYQETIGSYILMTDIDGMLYLNSVYISEKNAGFLIPLLQYCFTRLEEQGYPYRTMKVTMFSGESRVLLQKLSRGMKMEIENQIMMYRM